MKKSLYFFILWCFFCTGPMMEGRVFAQLASPSGAGFTLPQPGKMVHLSPPMQPMILKGLKTHPENPFHFNFIVSQGSQHLNNHQLRQESLKLIKYFLTGLTIPEKDLWVNLSPYEKDRIIPKSFGQTEMGRDLLAEDYLLKQITASLIHPETEIGKRFWAKVYKQAALRYKTTDISINTFNKVWIVPDKSVVYENVSKSGTDSSTAVAYVVQSKLKVMLDEDYLSLKKHQGASTAAQTHTMASQVVREVILPLLNKEINEGSHFSTLRQVFYSLILASWYKGKIKDSILNEVYADRNKLGGINISNSVKEEIYKRYLSAFKKGVFNYVKDSVDIETNQVMPKKYFAGGVEGVLLSRKMTHVHQINWEKMAADKAMIDVAVNITSLGLDGDPGFLEKVANGDAHFSISWFDRLFVDGKNIWRAFEEEYNLKDGYQRGSTEVRIKVGGRTFALKYKALGKRPVLTLPQELFEELARLKKWMARPRLERRNDNDVVFSEPDFDNVVINGRRKYDSFVEKYKLEEARFYQGSIDSAAFKALGVNEEALFAHLIARGYIDEAGKIQNKFIWLNGHQDMDDLNRTFSPHRQAIYNILRQWAITRVIQVGNRTFNLIRKFSGPGIVFTLPIREFEELAKLEEWAPNPGLDEVSRKNDAVFSATEFAKFVLRSRSSLSEFKAKYAIKEAPEHEGVVTVSSFKDLDINAQDVFDDLYRHGYISHDGKIQDKLLWRRAADEMDDLPPRIAPQRKAVYEILRKAITTVTINVQGKPFELVRKRSGVQMAYTLSRKEFEEVARLEEWDPDPRLDEVSQSNDAIFSASGFLKLVLRAQDTWPAFKEKYNIKEASGHVGIVTASSFENLKVDAQQVFEDLYHQGYISLDGQVQDKFLWRISPDEMDDLPDRIAHLRKIIYGILRKAVTTLKINVQGRSFNLVRKRSGGQMVYTLPREEFADLVGLEGWQVDPHLRIPDTKDIIVSELGFKGRLIHYKEAYASFVARYSLDPNPNQGIVYRESFVGIGIPEVIPLISDLYANGYINREGIVQNKFLLLTSHHTMKLDDRYKSKREQIYNILRKAIANKVIYVRDLKRGGTVYRFELERKAYENGMFVYTLSRGDLDEIAFVEGWEKKPSRKNEKEEAPPVDEAMTGGIDFSANTSEIRNGGRQIRFKIDKAMLVQLQNSTGFMPIIINIQPLTNLRLFLEPPVR